MTERGVVSYPGAIGRWPAGKIVGDIYEIRNVLGRGGMGIVYLAYDHATHKDVAVKVPIGPFVEDESARARIAREAEARTELVHPYIVRAFEVRDDQSTDYRPAIFMDYCDGGSLAKRLTRGRPALAEALDIAIQVCWAMEFAHRRGKIHRDLKPGNVLLTTEGKALVTDFGLVKFLEPQAPGRAPGAPAPGMAQSPAEPSAACGTREYMAPEQWTGCAGPESDLYAFGVMLFELCCGRLPFIAASPRVLRRLHEGTPPPDPRQFGGDPPERLVAVMLACLAKDARERASRLPDFGVVAAELGEAYEEITGRDFRERRAKPTPTELSVAEEEQCGWNLLRIAEGGMRRGDPMQDPVRLCRKAMDVFIELGLNTEAASAQRLLASLQRRNGDISSARATLSDIFRAITDLRDSAALQVLAGCYLDMANLEWRCGQLEAADRWLKRAAKLGPQVKDETWEIVFYHLTGLAAKTRGDWPGARRAYNQSMSVAKQIGDQAAVARLHNNLGNVAKNTGQIKEAEAHFRTAAEICGWTGDLVTLSQCRNGLGDIALQGKRHQDADAFYQAAREARERAGDWPGVAICLQHLGNVALASGDLERARDLYRQAIQTDPGNPGLHSVCYHNLSCIEARVGNIGEAAVLEQRSRRLQSKRAHVPTIGAPADPEYP